MTFFNIKSLSERFGRAPAHRAKRPLREAAELRRLSQFRVVLVLAFLAEILMSFNLWHSARFLPPVPIMEGFGPFGFPFEEVSLILLITLPGLIAIIPKPKYSLIGLVLVCIASVWGDLNRLQPWFYQYGFLLAILAFFYARPYSDARLQASLNTCRTVFCGMYLWAGLQKLNFGFISLTMPWLFSPLTKLPQGVPLLILGIGAALFEVAIGLALLSVRFRKCGIVMSITMHFLLLIALSPMALNRDPIIRPWNVAMAALVFLLFRDSENATYREILIPGTVVQAAVVAAFVILPVLSFFGKWDSYLSFKLYSANTLSAKLAFDPDEIPSLPRELQRAVRDGALSVRQWSVIETGVPPYVEERYFKGLMKNICRRLAPESKTTLIITSQPDWLTGKSESASYRCSELGGDRSSKREWR